MINQAVHTVDLMLWLLGDVVRVQSCTATALHAIESEDTAIAVLEFASGALGVIQAATSVHPGLPKTIAVHGDRGTVVIEQADILRWELSPESCSRR